MSNRFPSAHNWSSMTRYYGTNCLVGSKDEITLPKKTSEDNVVNYATKNGYKTIVKGPRTKWYLKGKNNSYDFLKIQLEKNMIDPDKMNNPKYRDRYVILIKFE